MRILIAEDDRTSREILAALLGKFGHEVVAARDGEEAWRVFEGENCPRLMVLDRVMPNLDGLSLCRRIRACQSPRPPYIIVLTAMSDKGSIVEGLDAGADDYVTKPFDHFELRARIDVGARILAMQDQLVAQAQELREALAQVKTLRGFIPICMHCKRVRDDRDFWREVEVYVSAHTEAKFSHGLCPECMNARYAEYIDPEEDEP